VSPKMEVNTEAPKVSLLREQFEQAQFIKDRFLVPHEMARRSQEESIKKVTLDTLPGVPSLEESIKKVTVGRLPGVLRRSLLRR
jgi:hypothetical protein